MATFERQYQIGDRVMVCKSDEGHTYGKAARIVAFLPCYPSQVWYEVEFEQPDRQALAADEFPRNRTHGQYTERTLCLMPAPAADGCDLCGAPASVSITEGPERARLCRPCYLAGWENNEQNTTSWAAMFDEAERRP